MSDRSFCFHLFVSQICEAVGEGCHVFNQLKAQYQVHMYICRGSTIDATPGIRRSVMGHKHSTNARTQIKGLCPEKFSRRHRTARTSARTWRRYHAQTTSFEVNDQAMPKSHSLPRRLSALCQCLCWKRLWIIQELKLATAIPIMRGKCSCLGQVPPRCRIQDAHQ